MKRNPSAFRSLTLAGLGLLALGTAVVPEAANAQSRWNRTWRQNDVRAAYRGFLVSEDGRYPRQAGSWIEIRINNFTTEREARAIIDMYNERDDRPLRHVLGNRDIGSLQIGDRRAQPLAAAWRIRDMSGEHLVLLVPRDPAVRELFPDRYDRNGRDRGRYDARSRYDRDRSNRYDRTDDRYDRRYGASDRAYALVQLDLGDDDDRYGRGELRTATRLRLGSDGGFDVDELDDTLPVRILHVEPIDPE
jgi:hypothetical protein